MHLHQQKPHQMTNYHDINHVKAPKPHKRWSLACNTIYFIVHLSKKVLLKNTKLATRMVSSPSYVALTVEVVDQQPRALFSIDQKSVTQMIRDRDLTSLSRLGGVKHFALMLGTNLTFGLSNDTSDDIIRRREYFGSNVFQKPPRKSFLSFLMEAFKDTTIVILLGCAVLSLGFGIKGDGPKEGWYDGGSIILSIFLVVSISSIINLKQSREFEKLSDKSSDIQVEVLRDGCRQKMSIFQVVVGDIVFLNIGDQIPGDGLFLDGYSMKVDESSMTGESEQVEVNDEDTPFLFSGTKVMDGYGRMLVSCVGDNTMWGSMMSSISGNLDEQTPLQERLNKLTSWIGKIGLVVASLVLIVLMIRYFTGHTKDEYGNREFNRGKTTTNQVMKVVIDIVSAAITIVVVAIPEGLPLAVTLTLAYSMKKMMADNAMVRKLSACETMGSATTICTDKTGTLTLNQMKVTSFWQGKEEVKKPMNLAVNVEELLKQTVGLNTTGSVCQSGSGTDSCVEISGSPTEKSLLSWAVFDLGMEIDELKRCFEVLDVETFNSEKKRSGVMLKNRRDNTNHVHWKGVAEIILGMCSSYYDRIGTVQSMDDEEKRNFEDIIHNMGSKSLRCIAFAHKQQEDYNSINVTTNIQENGVTLVGIVGLSDPCRPGVREAVKSCKNAGVDVKMITGDNMFTAKAVGVECGILDSDDAESQDGGMIEGRQFREYTHEERMEKIDGIRVMARSSPLDKLLIVKCLKLKGHAVAVTGDGTNDAPALKEADIGLSMGIQGTQVAKESSDIVILDDNFASVVTVLRWGRCVYSNIQKFIQFQLTVNISALTINFIASISSGTVPLTAVQLLWVNLIMDTLGALALATEQPTDECMNQHPVGRTEPLITKIMWRNLIAQALYQILILLILQFKGKSMFKVDERVKDTLIFNCCVLSQVFNEFNARKLEKKNIFEGILRNQLFLAIIGITILLQVLMVQFLNRFASTERLSLVQWGACITIAAITWLIGLLVKYIPISKINYMFPK